MITQLKTLSPSTSLKTLVALCGIALLLAAVPAVAQVSAADTLGVTGGVEQSILDRLTPDQLESFLSGADPATIVLEDGTTLEEFLLEGLIDTASNSVYHPLNQCLVVRTVTGAGKLIANTAVPYTVRGPSTDLSMQGGSASGCGVPTDATAVVMNVKAYQASGNGQVFVYPTGHTAVPSVINIQANQTINNMVTVAMGSLGDFSVKPSVAVHVVIHTVGYFAPLAGAVGPTGPTGMDGADGPTGPTGPGGLPLTCATNEFARWDGNAWVCAPDPMTAAVKAGVCSLFGETSLTPPEFCPLAVFVTSGLYTGNLVAEASSLCWIFGGAGPTFGQCPEGLTAGDAICSKLAFDAGLPGALEVPFAAGEPRYTGYKAWLSTSTVDAKDRLTVANNPWNRVDGVRVADDLADLLDCTEGTGGEDCLENPINRTESGAGRTWLAWTGTFPSGIAAITANGGAGEQTCANWTLGGLGNWPDDNGKLGVPSATTSEWTSIEPGHRAPCFETRSLYCFGQ